MTCASIRRDPSYSLRRANNVLARCLQSIPTAKKPHVPKTNPDWGHATRLV